MGVCAGIFYKISSLPIVLYNILCRLGLHVAKAIFAPLLTFAAKVNVDWTPSDDDVVYLHGFCKWFKEEDVSPFVIKLETYLQAIGVKYKYVINGPLSKKGKKPWIYYNGEQIDDSQTCIEYLAEKFKVDLDADLTTKQKAESLIVLRTLEHSTYFQNLSYRWDSERTHEYAAHLGENTVWFLKPMFIYFPTFMASLQKDRLLGHGIGHFSKEDILKMSKEDVTAMMSLMEGPFFHGKFSAIDCSIYAALHCMFETMENPADRNLEVRAEARKYCKLVRRYLNRHKFSICEHTAKKAKDTGRDSVLGETKALISAEK